MDKRFEKDVINGLTAHPKYLPSKYFYDKKGDALFQQIMKLPEYYLTDAELEIFKTKAADIVAALDLSKGIRFELIELGAGDGLKTKALLRYLLSEGYSFDYIPIDISQNALDKLSSLLNKDLPQLSVRPKQGMYFDVLKSIGQSTKPKVVLFLGSNLGNMPDETATVFMQGLSTSLNKNDKVFVGLDLIKPKEIVLPAYNDSKGVTAAFNLNLLDRINAELGGDFNKNQFRHCPEYNEKTGITKSFLKSKTEQLVHLKSANVSFSFKAEEKIFMEISRKYSDQILQEILEPSYFSIREKLLDSRKYFADYVLVKH